MKNKLTKLIFALLFLAGLSLLLYPLISNVPIPSLSIHQLAYYNAALKSQITGHLCHGTFLVLSPVSPC